MMSGRKRWPWLAGVAAVHLLVLSFAVPRTAPPVIKVRISTAVSFQTAPSAPAPAAQASTKSAVTGPASADAPVSAVTSEPALAGGSDAGSAASEGEAASVVGTYLARLRQAVADNKNYPYAARTRRQEGTVLLAFRLDGRGGLADEPQVLQSSGYPRLDAAAIEAVKVSSPFVAPPEAARPWEFRLPVEFVAR